MKLTSFTKMAIPIMALGLITSLLLTHPVFASGKPFKKFTLLTNDDPKEEKPAKKNKVKSKNFTSLNNSSVKIYPDVIKRDMHVLAKDNNRREIDFYVFDVEGTLVIQYKMKAKDHYRITGLARGTYVYRVFNGDEETASGNFEIR